MASPSPTHEPSPTWRKNSSDLPHLAAGLSSGDLSFDKVRAVADVATPETDGDLALQAQECTVRQLHEVARTERGVPRSRAQTDYEARSVRFNDTVRTVTAQLPPESYAEVKSCLESRARALPSDGETSWDQRLCDALRGRHPGRSRDTAWRRARLLMSWSSTFRWRH